MHNYKEEALDWEKQIKLINETMIALQREE